MEFQPILANAAALGVVAVNLAIGVALYGIAALTRKKVKPRLSDDVTKISTRGTFIPLVLGRARISPVFAWVGNRKVKKKKVGKGFGSGTSTFVYFESGIHYLCVGPGYELNRIWVNGKVVYDTTITTSTPSGSVIDIEDVGQFAIYWGENDQPLSNRVAAWMELFSTLPNVMRIEWIDLALGSTPNWPNIEYEVTVRPLGGGLSGTSWLAEDVDGFNCGVNPAHAMWQILTMKFPHGVGLDVSLLDAASFEALADVCVEEHLPVTLIAEDGESAEDLIQRVLEDVGCQLSQVGDKLVVFPMRQQDIGDMFTLDGALIVDSDIETEQQHAEQSATRYTYSIRDRANDYTQSTISVDSDAESRQMNAQKPVNFSLDTIGDQKTGWMVANRKAHDLDAEAISMKFDVLRSARRLVPGQQLLIEDIGRVRVMTAKRMFDQRGASLQCVLDEYGLTPSDYIDETIVEGTPMEAEPDLFVFAARIPEELAGTDERRIGVARVRAHAGIIGSRIYMAIDGSTYYHFGSQDEYAAGGTLNRPIPIDEGGMDGVIDDGPTITSYNNDITDVDDLTGNDAAWEAGEQIAVINGEWFFLKKVEAVDGGWKLRGLIRARYGTVAAAHDVDDPVIIFKANQQEVFGGTMIENAATSIEVKSRPSTATESVDLADVTAVNVDPI